MKMISVACSTGLGRAAGALVMALFVGCQGSDSNGEPNRVASDDSGVSAREEEGAHAGNQRDVGTSDPAPASDADGVGQGAGGRDASRPDVSSTDLGEAAAADAGAPGPAATQRWSSYGYDLHNRQDNPDEHLLSAENVAQLRENWRVRFPAGATSTPVVYDGMVYFGGWDGSVYSVDAQTGEIRWQTHVTDMLVRSTPLVTDDRIFAAAGPNLVALNRADGKTIFETALDPSPDTLIDSSPKLVEGLVIIGVSSVETGFVKDDYSSIGAVVAIDADTGALVWRVPTTGEGSGPCVGGAGVSVWSTAAVDEELGLAYIGTGQAHEAPASACSDAVLAIHYRREHQGERVAWIAQYNEQDVYSSSPENFFGLDGDIGAAPNLFEAAGMPLVGAGDKAATYRAFDRRTGELVWRADLDHGDSTGVGGVMTTAAVHDGTIYVSSNHWAGVLSTPLSVVTGVADPTEFSTLYALDAATGTPRWQVALPAPMFGSFAIANGLLYHPVIYGTLFARELATGNAVWSVEVGGGIGVGPSVANGRVYISAGYGEVGTTTATPDDAGGFVASFGLASEPSKVWEGAVAELKPMSEAECKTAVQKTAEWPIEGGPSDACAACLCQCDATASGYCDSCWQEAPCIAQICWLAAPEDMARCMGIACQQKLLPSYVFERAVDIAPCAINCASECGF